MPLHPDEIVARARALIGTRFRPQGRSAADGLDCVGLAALAIGVVDAPRDYALRGASLGRLTDRLQAAGLSEADVVALGDLLVLAPGQAQLHLGIFTGTGLVHGDIALRRVVERPLPLPWPVLGIWRF
ncbi:peptidoglycan endopeptidase [Allosphingosinicella sp.]|uniref:peptidoglycan endopeptidase n=1 Tax=Allosphingosinicella sp. TaxID=2823234 RepID=UPI0037840553